MKGLEQFGTLKPKCHRMGLDGISPDRSISRSPSGDNKCVSCVFSAFTSNAGKNSSG